MTIIKEDSKVKVHYTGKLSDGTIFDSSKAVEGQEQFIDRDPLDIELGKGMLIPGFEKALQGMAEGETKTVTIESADAYGPIQENHYQEVEKEFVPDTVKEGDMLQTENEQKQVMQVTVKEVKENTVVLDANHPLAGKDLTFELEVVTVA
tara:strand:- start:68 stop:517 length:450 start_codon:yes stop_codon:yes gene_type:complete